MKHYEKEAFIKTFSIFFLSLTLLTSIVAYFYYSEQKHIMEEQIFSEMKEFTYDFQSKKFDVDVIAYRHDVDRLNLQPCVEGMCAYFSIPTSKNNMFKVILSHENYHAKKNTIIFKVFVVYSFILGFIFLFSLLYSFYALYPLKKALDILESFLKDMIHDLNTPVTSILLNTKAMAKSHACDALERIELAAQTIASLYRNLEVLHQGFIPHKHDVDLKELLHVRAKLYQKLYPHLSFVFNTHAYIVSSDSDSIARIFDNLISNACKYNKKKGTVTLCNQNNIVTISDTGVGIKQCERIFERYYKEHPKGLGLGLNIVQSLCQLLGIHISVTSQLEQGTTITLVFPTKENA